MSHTEFKSVLFMW